MPIPYWYFNPYIIPLIITGLLAGGFVVYSLRRRTVAATLPFAALCGTLTGWAFVAAIQISTNDFALAHTLSKIEQLAFTLVPPCWFWFAALFTGRDQWLRRWRVAALFIAPALMVLLFWTNDLHGWMLTEPEFFPNRVGENLITENLSLFWLHVAIAYIFVFVGSAMILRYAFTSKRIYRYQALGLIFAALIPFVANIITISGLNPLPIDITPLVFSLSMVFFALAVFQFKMLDLVPLTYEKLLGTLKEGVIVLDTQNRIVQTNPAALKLIDGDARHIIGMSAEHAFAAMQPEIALYLDQTEHDGEIKVGSSEKLRWFAVRVTPLTERSWRGERMRGCVMVISEVTVRKQNELALAEARDQALQLDQFKTQLLSSVSHDLRTPLAAIQGFAELIRGGFYDANPTKLDDALTSIINDSIYLNQLVNQLLDKSALNTGRIELHRAPFAPKQLAQTTIERASILAEMKGLAFSVEVSPDLPDCMEGDLERLTQIITNLTGNAIKFTETGSVRVRFYVPDPLHWAVAVTDSGNGIPEEFQAAVFEPFRQLHQEKPRSGRGRGFGLGLTIVKDLTAMMDGTVTVESHVGQGSTFTVCLPLIPIEENADAAYTTLRVDH